MVPPGLFLLSVVAMSVVFAGLVNRTAGSVVATLLTAGPQSRRSMAAAP